MMMSKEFVLLVGVSALIATPVVFALMRGWLDNFAYRTELGPGVFVFGALVALVIAQTTVTFHSLRAAHTDPCPGLAGIAVRGDDVRVPSHNIGNLNFRTTAFIDPSRPDRSS